MRMRILKSAALILALILTVLAIVGCAVVPPADDSGDGTFLPKKAFNVTVSERYADCKEVQDASVYVRRAFKAVYGMQCTTFDEIDEGTPEILIGDVGREETDAAISGLGIDDYSYEIVSEKLIVIVGGSLSATYEGVKSFCDEVLGYDGEADGENISLTVGAKRVRKDTYAYESLEINGVPLSEVTLALGSYTEISQVSELVQRLGAYTGEHLRVTTYGELTGAERGVICIGAEDRDGERLTGLSLDSYKLRFDGHSGGFTASICAANRDSYEDAIEAFLTKARVSGSGSGRSLTFDNLNEIKCEAFDELDEWTLIETSTETVTDGVVYTYYSYEDTAGKPYKVFVMEVDPEKVDFYMGSGGDKTEYAPSVKQSVKGHIESATASGLSVFGGINGDFFRISGDYSPCGLAVKEGEFISNDTAGRGYVGFTYDGKCIIDTIDYATSGYEFRTAVGGRQVLLKNGMPSDVGTDDEFSLTAHPRTMVGVKEDGKVLLVVVDGRRSSYSNGAPLKRCAKIMFDLGAVSALNLDGGGSSTMCTVSDGKITTKNNPSDGILRRIYNSILIVEKKDPAE